MVLDTIQYCEIVIDTIIFLLFTGYLQWKNNLRERASVAFMERQSEVSKLRNLVYGQQVKKGLFIPAIVYSLTLHLSVFIYNVKSSYVPTNQIFFFLVQLY